MRRLLFACLLRWQRGRYAKGDPRRKTVLDVIAPQRPPVSEEDRQTAFRSQHQRRDG